MFPVNNDLLLFNCSPYLVHDMPTSAKRALDRTNEKQMDIKLMRRPSDMS
jgi:hypothetical protein